MKRQRYKGNKIPPKCYDDQEAKWRKATYIIK